MRLRVVGSSSSINPSSVRPIEACYGY